MSKVTEEDVKQMLKEELVDEVAAAKLPAIDADDKLTFRTMEAEIYRAQVDLQSRQKSFEDQMRGINEFLKTLHEKYGVDQKVATIDPKKIEFVSKEKQ